MVPLGASDSVDVKPSQVWYSKQEDIWKRANEYECVSIVIVNELVDQEMGNRNKHAQSKSCEEESFIFFMTRPMDPLKQANDEAYSGNNQTYRQVDSRNCQLTIHSVIKRREHAARDQKIDTGIVKSVRYGVCLYVKNNVLLDIG